MNLTLPFLALTVILGSTAQGPPPPAPTPERPAFAARRAAAERIIAESGAEVSVAYRSLDGSEEWWHEAAKPKM